MLLIILAGLITVVAAIQSQRHFSKWLGPWELHPWPPEEGYPTVDEVLESHRHELMMTVYFTLAMVAFLAFGSLAIYS